MAINDMCDMPTAGVVRKLKITLLIGKHRTAKFSTVKRFLSIDTTVRRN